MLSRATWIALQVDADVHRQRLARLLVPGGDGLRGLVHRPAAELEDQPAFLGDRDEFGRADLAAVVMGPACQRLEPRDLARLQIDQRLVEQLQLVLVERAAKLGLDREAPARRARFPGLIDLRLARRLGLLDRELGVAEQLFRILTRLHQCNADRAFDPDFELAQLERRGHHLLDPLRRGQRIFDPALQPDEDAELIASGPGQHVTAAERRDQPPGEGDQQLVAGQAAHRLVDAAEAQHVDHQHRIFAVTGAGRSPLTLDRLGERQAVGQPGQAVAQHFGAQRPLRLDLDRPVDQADEAARAVLFARATAAPA